MTAYEEAVARIRAYALFSRLFLEAPDERLLPALRVVPELAIHLPEPYDADAASADHHDLLGFNVYPYASVFLEKDARIGGRVSLAAASEYAVAGFDGPDTGEPSDHVGREFGFMAHLAAAEAAALAAGEPGRAERRRGQQQRFIGRHLCWWLPSFAEAIRRQGPSLYAAAADLSLALVADDGLRLSPQVAPDAPQAAPGAPQAAPDAPQAAPDAPEATPDAPNAAPDAPDAPLADDSPVPSLDDEHTGLADIARFLATPARSGFYLSREEIRRLGRQDRLPGGFGDRTQMLATLLRSAAEFERVDSLIDRLIGAAAEWQRMWREGIVLQSPVFAMAAERALTRLDGTTGLLVRMSALSRERLVADEF